MSSQQQQAEQKATEAAQAVRHRCGTTPAEEASQRGLLAALRDAIASFTARFLGRRAQAKDAAGAQAASAQATAHSTAASAKQHLSAMGEARAHADADDEKSHRGGDGATHL
jgi:hypothetical protein